MKKLLSIVLPLSILFIGCATIIHGTTQKVAVNSNPSGAKVIVMGAHLATTPAVIKLDRGDSNIILRFEKEGYEPVEIAMTKTVDGWIAGNIVFGGLIGLAIDFISGAAYKLKPDEVLIDLHKKELGFNDLKDNELIVYFEIKN